MNDYVRTKVSVGGKRKRLSLNGLQSDLGDRAFRCPLTLLFFALSGGCAAPRSAPLSALWPAPPAFGALVLSVWRCVRGLLVLAGAQYISKCHRSQLWKQHSSTMPLERRELEP